jgi:hypothetical protein
MARHLLRDCQVTVGGADISSCCSSVLIETARPEADASACTDRKRRAIAGGPRSSAISLAVFQDFAKVDQALWPIGVSREVAVRLRAEPISLTNPEYRMEGRLFDYTPLAGAVGQAATLVAVFKNATRTGIVRFVADAFGDGLFGEGTFGD